MLTKKQIIFFDGDGTLWYPKKTKREQKPHWIYKMPGTISDHCQQLILIPTVLSTLKKLKARGIITILLSTHPHPPKEAAKIINHKIDHFKLAALFDEIHATREAPDAKGKFILKILQQRRLPKNRALMIGDHYRWDYQPARAVGVDALLLESKYMKTDPHGKKIKNTIKKLSAVLNYI